MAIAREVNYARGGETLRGHLAAPDERTDRPAIVLIPDVHGLSDLYREIAGRFAARGFATLAVDLYTREGAPKLTSPVEAMRWIARLPDQRILGDVQAAIHFLAAGGSGRRVGITGFCMGGQYALLAACMLRGLDASVSFYGMVRYQQTNDLKPKSPLDAAVELGCPYLGIFGEEDAIIPMEDVAALRTTLESAGKRFRIDTYAGCGHAFLNHNRPDAYRPQAAAQAFESAVELFTTHLSAPLGP